jgi:hypothetical protein
MARGRFGKRDTSAPTADPNYPPNASTPKAQARAYKMNKPGSAEHKLTWVDTKEIVEFKVFPAKEMLRTSRNLHTIEKNVVLEWMPQGTTYCFVTFKFHIENVGYLLAPEKEDITFSYFLLQAMMDAIYGKDKYKIDAFSIPSDQFMGAKPKNGVENLAVHCVSPISS